MKIKNITFKIIAKPPGINHKGSNPPKKIKATKNEIVKRLAYSPIKNIPHLNPEYSVAYPATNSASCSNKSNGVLFVSANPAIVNRINAKG